MARFINKSFNILIAFCLGFWFIKVLFKYFNGIFQGGKYGLGIGVNIALLR